MTDPDPVVVLMDLARYHYDEERFYEEEMKKATGETATVLAFESAAHSQAASAARAAAEYIAGRRNCPKAVAAGRALRDDGNPVPWRDDGE